MNAAKGILYLIPATLGSAAADHVIPNLVIEKLMELDHFIVENIRTARRYLRKTGYTKEFDTVQFFILDKKTQAGDFANFLAPAEEGFDMGLLSEAGLPAVADPGAEIVKIAHSIGIRVVPFTGPSSIMLGLMASGFNGQSFNFHGYLPIQKKTRENKIIALEKQIYQFDQTQIFIETPYRNLQMLESILKVCQAETMLCVACDLTTENELIISKPVKQWQGDIPEIHKRPAVFLMYK